MSKKTAAKEKPEVETEGEGEDALPKKTSIVVHIVVFLLITAAAAGAGFGASMFLKTADPAMETEADDKSADSKPDDKAHKDDHANDHGDGHGDKKDQKKKNDSHAKPGEDKKQEDGILQAYATPLEPILTNLAAPTDVWVRMELAVVAKGKMPDDLLEKIHQDLFAYMRTVKLHHIEGPSGFINLKAELTDRASTRSGGAVKFVLVRTLVME